MQQNVAPLTSSEESPPSKPDALREPKVAKGAVLERASRRLELNETQRTAEKSEGASRERASHRLEPNKTQRTVEKSEGSSRERASHRLEPNETQRTAEKSEGSSRERAPHLLELNQTQQKAEKSEGASHERALLRAKTGTLFFLWDWLLADALRALAVGLLAAVGLGLLWTAANFDVRIDEKVAEVSAKRDELQENIDNLASEMEANLKNMAESSAYLAERNFEGKLRDIRRFLKRVSEPSRGSGASTCLDEPAAAEPFRKYILQWVTVYQECEFEVGTPPKALSEALQKLERSSDIAAYTSKWLEAKRPKVVGAALERFSRKRWDKPREDLPPAHQYNYLLTLSALLCGAAVAVAAALRGDLVTAGLAALSTLLSPFAFIRNGNQIARLTAEIEQLREKNEAVRSHNLEVAAIFTRLEQHTNMWQLRTVPHLDLLKEVHDVILAIPQDKVAFFLQRATASLDLVTQALGPLAIWTGEHALSELELVVVASQLTDKHAGVSPKRARGKHTLMGKLTARVALEMRKVTLGQSVRDLTDKEVHAKVDDWVSADDATKCDEPTCQKIFYMTTRRHNCRVCGRVFCGGCTVKMPVPKLGYHESERVCSRCAASVQHEAEEERRLAENEPPLPDALSGVVQLGFLRVRVKSASSLKTDVGPPNAYVRLRLGETADWVQTVTIHGSANPQWKDEEFIFPVRANDTTLMVQVVDDTVPNSMENMLGFLGSLDAKFRQLGCSEWTSMRCPLEGRKSGVLEFDMRFSEDAWHLL